MIGDNIITPSDWFKTNVTSPAYVWIGAFVIVSSSSFISGFLLKKYKCNFTEKSL